MTVAGDDRGVHEAPRETPVRRRVEVLVAGGGPAGVGAALAAAREGARTLLVERHGMLGGMWTAGLVNPFFESHRNGWLVSELVERLRARGAWRQWRFAYTFDPEAMKAELEAMMQQAGVELLYHTLCVDTVVEGGTARGAIIESKAGREAVLADVVVDCTGDGDVAARAGAPFELGRLADGLVQPMTLMFEIEGAAGYDQPSARELYDKMAEVLARRGLGYVLRFERVDYAPWIITLPGGASAVQLTHVYRLNPLDPADLTAGTLDARRQAAEAVEILRHVPGLEGARLARTAEHIGVRETRRILGRYQLWLEDLVAGRTFGDGVATCGFGVDIHDPAPGSGIKPSRGVAIKPYEIPYRCLVPREVEGMLVAGRCLSGTHEAQASYRVTGTCLATGQAAGLAAAWAVGQGVAPAAVEGKELREALRARGVRMIEDERDA